MYGKITLGPASNSLIVYVPETEISFSRCSYQQQSVILITENTQKVEEREINGINYSVPIIISGCVPTPHFREFKGVLLYFSNELSAISEK